MQKKQSRKILSWILCMSLIVAMAMYTAGCNGKTENGPSAGTETEARLSSDSNVLGEGEKEFSFTVTDKDGKETSFEIHTDKETVGEALQEIGMIDGEDSEYGLYVKTVNGIEADFDEDGVYWAFYINDEYAQTGADSTPITEGESYSFKME